MGLLAPASFDGENDAAQKKIEEMACAQREGRHHTSFATTPEALARYHVHVCALIRLSGVPLSEVQKHRRETFNVDMQSSPYTVCR